MELMPHIRLPQDLGVKYAILPGDPGRVDRVAEYLTNPQQLAFNREYKSVLGTYKGIPILVMSTGMGGPSTAIGVEELAKVGIKAAIRIGSCGCLTGDMHVGDILLVSGAIREDGTTKSYVPTEYPAIPDRILLDACEMSAISQSFPYKVGLARSHDRLYDDVDEAKQTRDFWAKRGVLGSDMETSALFVVGMLRGMKTASILNVVAVPESSVADGVGAYNSGESSAADGEQREILTALESFVYFRQ